MELEKGRKLFFEEKTKVVICICVRSVSGVSVEATSMIGDFWAIENCGQEFRGKWNGGIPASAHRLVRKAFVDMRIAEFCTKLRSLR